VIPSVQSGVSQGAAVTANEPDPRLKPAAHEFEACLMKEFLEPLQKDALFSEDGDEAGSEGRGNALMGFGSEALARAISQRGGFGIATRIIDHFEHRDGSAGRGEPPWEPAEPEMKIGLKV
jgi:peptidoglycan hydrolase FlgJ